MPNDGTTAALRDAALAYAARGWRVLPLHGIVQGRCTCLAGGTCRTPGKHPLLPRWIEQASYYSFTVRRWWQHHPHANVGIATGFASGLVVVDVDPRHGGHIAWEELLAHYGALPLSPQVLTGGGGTHDYLWCAEALAGVDLAAGIQFQAEGRLVVAPPSLHISGRRYTWEASHDPDDIPLAPLPAWIRERAGAHQHSDDAPGGNLLPVVDAPPVHRLQVSPRIKHLIQWGIDPEQPTRYPSRSEAVFAVIQALLHARVDHATIAAILLHPDYRISDKPHSQRDPRSPRYDTAIREWVAKEIHRARAKMGGRPQSPAERRRALSRVRTSLHQVQHHTRRLRP